ncbi:MAG: O-antigen ligase family protein [Pseudoflavonifractor sp.]
MYLAQNSVVLGIFIALWGVLRDAWQGSLLGRVFARIGTAICRGVAGSRICDLVWRESRVMRGWRESYACRIFTALINLPCTLVKWIYTRFKVVFDGSLGFRIASAIGGASFVFVGFSMLLMLVAPHAKWNNAYTLLCMEGLFLVFLAGCATRPKYRLELDQLGPYYLLFVGFVGCAFLGSLSSGLSMRFFIFHVIAILLTIFTVSTIRKREQLQLVLVLVAAGMTVAAIYGCYQGIVGVPVVANQQDLILNEGMPGRVFSFFDNPNNFAEILVMLMPFLLALFLNADTWRGKALAVVAMVPCVAAIGFTLSRSGWIGLALAVAVFLVLQNWRLLPLMLVLGIAAIPFLPESILNRILTIGNPDDSSTKYRFAIYGATANLMRDYGVRGVGLGSDVMAQVFKVFPTMFDGNYPIHTHNNYLQMWGELGLFGGISYVALIFAQLKAGVKSFYGSKDKKLKNILAAALGAFCGILVIGVAEYTWFYVRNMFVWWFLFGVIAACVKLARAKKEA